MKKNLLISILLVSAFSSRAQRSGDIHGWIIGLNASPEITYRVLTPRDFAESGGDYFYARRQAIDKPRFGYTAMVSGGYRWNSGWSLELGAGYSEKGYQTRKFSGEYMFNNDSLVRFQSGKYICHCFDFPLKVGFTAGRNKLRFITSLAVMGSLFQSLRSGSIDHYAENSISHLRSYTVSKMYIGAFLSAGLEYAPAPRWMLRTEPVFRYVYPSKLWNAGLNLGVYYMF